MNQIDDIRKRDADISPTLDRSPLDQAELDRRRLLYELDRQIVVGVTAVIRSKDGKRVLLGRKGRSVSQEFIGKWVTPGGKVIFGETLFDAIVREVKEETTLNFYPMKTLPISEYINYSIQLNSTLRHYLFYVYEGVVDDESSARPDSDLQDVRWFTFPELVANRSIMTPVTRGILFYGQA